MSGTNPEKPPIPQEQQLYPPPPTGNNQQQHPPQYSSNEKSELQGQDQHFPPPPPGPPPANQPQFTHAPQSQQHYGDAQQQYQQPQFAQPPLGQNAPAQHTNEKPLPDYNPSQYGAGHHYQQQYDGPPGSAPDASGAYADPAAAHAAYTAPVATDPAGQKAHRGWGERLSQIGMKAAVPINALANKMGSQSFLPTTMDKECEKAAKILKSFCSKSSPPPLLSWHDPR